MGVTFGERLRQLRKARGWTHRDLCAELQTTPAAHLDFVALSKLEGGHIDPHTMSQEAIQAIGYAVSPHGDSTPETFMLALNLLALADEPFTPAPPTEPGQLRFICGRESEEHRLARWQDKLAAWNANLVHDSEHTPQEDS